MARLDIETEARRQAVLLATQSMRSVILWGALEAACAWWRRTALKGLN